MKKLTKAVIAAAAGGALLLGGAGTLATWNSSGTVSTAGTIAAGNLNVGSATVVGWSVQHLTAGTYGSAVTLTPAQFTAFRAVPGDKLTYTATVPITATGNNLVATTSLSGGSITAATASAADVALASALTTSATTTMSIPATTGVTGTGPTYTFTPAGATINAVATVSATITYPLVATAGAENASILGTVNLTNVGVTITQTY